MKVLGLNGWIERGHDGGASLVVDGKLVYAVEEERLLRRKHAYDTIPELSIKNALNFANLKLDDIDKFVIGWDYPSLFKMINVEFISKEEMSKHLFGTEKYADKIDYLTHHKAHACSAFYPSGYEDSLVLVIDGQGEYMGTSIYKASRDNKELELLMETPVSLGYFYAGITQHVGFRGGEEGKAMGLASYGVPKYYDELSKIIYLDENDKLCCKIKIDKVSKDEEDATIAEWEKYLLEIMPRREGGIKSVDESVVEYANLAASAEKVLEDITERLVRKYTEETGIHNVCIAGGVGLNCPMSSNLESLDCVEKVFVQPAANDGGISLGAAIYGAVQLGDNIDIEMIPYLGNLYTEEDIVKALEEKGYEYEKYDNIEKKIAELLSEDMIVGNYQGRIEFGPRALGNRSILSSPKSDKMLERVNVLKGREVWRPLAPAVMYDKQTEYFDSNIFSPHMTKNFNVLEDKKSEVPAITHVDGTARVQSVTEHYNKRFYNIIKEFYNITGTAVVINTSFNIKGEPIVDTPMDAIKCFENMRIDYLALGDYLIKSKIDRVTDEEINKEI